MKDVRKGHTLSEAEIRYKTLFEQSPDGILLIGLDGTIVEFNEAAHRMLGYTREEFGNVRIADINLESAEKIQACVRRLLERGKAEFEARYKAKDGVIKDVEVISRVVVLSGKKLFHSIWRDITKHKLAEKSLKDSAEALKQANTRFQTLLHAIPDSVFFKDAEGRYVVVNKAFEECIGSCHGDIIGKTDEELMPPDTARGCRKSDEEVTRGSKVVHLEDEINMDNEKRFLYTTKVPLYDKDRNCAGVVGITRDVTERRKTEAALRESREFIRSILDTVDEAFIVIDREYRIVLANRAYGRQASMPVEDVIGRHCFEVSHRSSKPCFEEGEECAVRHSFERGEPRTCVHKHCNKDGSVLYVETKSYPLKDASGSVISAIEVINNITDKHLLEEQLLRTQKLEAVGLLAGGIAHDFNNLLQGVFGSISLARMFADKEGKSHQMLEGAEKALTQARNLTKQLLTFSKGGEPVKRVIYLPSVIHNSVKFALSGSNVKPVFSMSKDLWSVEADEGQITQVMHNIALNAVDAMPGGGTVRITVENYQPDEKCGLPLKRGKYVKTAVGDSGVGIPDAHISRIFDPYFTTKQKGSGLGLTTAYAIIRKHGGLLDLESEPGAGSIFFIYLPASEETIPPEAEQDRKLVRGRGGVLIMDDEEVVRTVAGHMISSLGYEAAFAENGEEAIEKYGSAARQGRPFDAVILDLTIRGGMGGRETIRKLIEIDPSVRAVVSSGYSEDPILSSYKDYGFKALLSKPYEIGELSSTLHALVGTQEK